MKMTIKPAIFLYLFAPLLLVACSTSSNTLEQANKPLPPKVAKDKNSCLEQNGEWMKAGILGNYMCIFKASDAGKTCSDSKACEYRCLASSAFTPKETKKVTGICQASSNPFGCRSEVIKGVAQPALCAD